MLAASGQALEHYEIARYGTLKTWALQLGHEDAAKLLDETLQEEKKTDQLLTELAERLNVEGTEGDTTGASDSDEATAGKSAAAKSTAGTSSSGKSASGKAA